MSTGPLETHLQNYDGKAVSLLSEARVACRNSASYFDNLIALCIDSRATISDGATWILKAEFEDGAVLSPELTELLVASLDKLNSWQAMLHVCQGVAGFRFTSAQADRFVGWAKTLSDHSRPFLRGWSMNAIVVLGQEFAAVRDDAEAALLRAENDPAASVRARARQLRKGAK